MNFLLNKPFLSLILGLVDTCGEESEDEFERRGEKWP